MLLILLLIRVWFVKLIENYLFYNLIIKVYVPHKVILCEDYPHIKVPLALKQEVDSRAKHSSKPATDTSLYRMLINTSIPNDLKIF